LHAFSICLPLPCAGNISGLQDIAVYRFYYYSGN
jgi:hypothetical protein